MGAVQASSNTFSFSTQPVLTISEFPAVYTLVSSNSASVATITATVLSGSISLSGITSASLMSGSASFTDMILTAPRGGSGILQFTAAEHLAISGAVDVAPRFKFNGIAKNPIIRIFPGTS